MPTRALLLAGFALALSCTSSRSALDRRVGDPVAGWRTGDQRAYEVSLAMHATIAGAPVTQFELRARWVVTALDVGDERAVLRAELEGGTLRTEHGALQAEYAALERELGAPFVFAVQRDGRLGDAYLESRTPAIVVGIWRTLAASLQFVRAEPAAGGEWTVDELDTTGRYVARYRPSDAPRRYTKDKLRYLEVVTGGGGPQRSQISVSAEVVDAAATLELDDRDGIAAVEMRERTRTALPGMAPIEWASTLSLTLRTVHVVAPATDWKRLLESRERYAPDRAFADRPNTQQRDEALIRGRRLDDLLAEVESLAASPPGSAVAADGDAHERARGEAFAALRAALRSQPGAVGRALALIEADPARAPALIDGLGGAGTAEAQQALRELLASKRLDPAITKLAAIALSRSPDPRAESMRALAALLEDPWLGAQAAYGLGTMARRLRLAGKLDDADAAVAILRERLDRAPSALRTIIALRGIANSGAAAMFSSIEPLFDHADDGVRAAATEALQLMDDPRVDPALAHRIEHDPRSSVRLAAARAARLRDPSPALRDFVQARVRAEPDDHVRLGLVRVLAAWLPTHREVAPTLSWVGEHDAQEAVRREARQALTGRSAPGQPSL
jgi:hypothetical protein